jgi:hypothetical protein
MPHHAPPERLSTLGQTHRFDRTVRSSAAGLTPSAPATIPPSLLLVCDDCQLAGGPFSHAGEVEQLAAVHDLIHHRGRRTTQVLDSPQTAAMMRAGETSGTGVGCRCCPPGCVTCTCTAGATCPCPAGLDRLAGAVARAHLPHPGNRIVGRPGLAAEAGEVA